MPEAGNDKLTVEDEPARRKLYGRRKGHKLSARQAKLMETLLPRLRLHPEDEAIEPELIMPEACEVWLEVGFGKGEHMLAQAAAHRDVLLLGCEPFVNGLAGCLAGIDETGITNVRLWDGDAREVIDSLPAESLARVFILHPDPWPKRRHHKRRIINISLLESLARVMKGGAELRISSDVPDLVDWVIVQFDRQRDFIWLANSAADWCDQPLDWPETRYASKALRQGRRPYYLRFVRKTPIPASGA